MLTRHYAETATKCIFPCFWKQSMDFPDQNSKNHGQSLKVFNECLKMKNRYSFTMRSTLVFSSKSSCTFFTLICEICRLNYNSCERLIKLWDIKHNYIRLKCLNTIIASWFEIASQISVDSLWHVTSLRGSLSVKCLLQMFEYNNCVLIWDCLTDICGFPMTCNVIARQFVCQMFASNVWIQ